MLSHLPHKKSHPFWEFTSQNYTSKAEGRKQQVSMDCDLPSLPPRWSGTTNLKQFLIIWFPQAALRTVLLPTHALSLALSQTPLASGSTLLTHPPFMISGPLLVSKLSGTSPMRSKRKLTLSVHQYLWCAKCRGQGRAPLIWVQDRHWTCLLLLFKMYFSLVMNYCFRCVLQSLLL